MASIELHSEKMRLSNSFTGIEILKTGIIILAGK